MSSRASLARAVFVGSLLALAAACGGDDDKPTGNIFPTRPECTGEDVVPHMGQKTSIFSSLSIVPPDEGFDLDGDGKVDNRLGPIGVLAQTPINEALAANEIIIPVEFFDMPAVAPDECVKFAFYLGKLQQDVDGDGAKTSKGGGDCNDNDELVGPGSPEIEGNRRDDNCNGINDDAAKLDDQDMDGDGVTLADGDCDDTNIMMAPGLPEICGDGLDNDCKQGADFTIDENGDNVCSPFDDDLSGEIPLDDLSFNPDGSPIIEFNAGTIKQVGDKLVLEGGPSLFSVTIPIEGNLLALTITGATITADISTDANGNVILENGLIGGVFDARTMDQVRGLEVSEIGLLPENSFLDAMFTSPTLVAILTLPRRDVGEFVDCVTPDIDVDRDGLEGFCDSNPTDGVYTVDVCIDGDGTIYRDGDMGSVHCTEIKNPDGTYKFIDGVSVALGFRAVPAVIKE